MTTENQKSTISKTPTTPNSTTNLNTKLSTTLEERKGNAMKPLSLRPNRSVKKNLSLKPFGMGSR
jgi:hypothetical protein